MFKHYVFIITLTLICLKTNGQTKAFKKQLDSIQTLRQLSKNIDFDIETRIQYAKKASELSYKTEVDSVILNSNRNIINIYFEKKDFNIVKKICYENLKLARRTTDSANIAHSAFTLGEYYSSHNTIIPESKIDSAYFYYNVAKKIYKRIKVSYNYALVLYRIAAIQCDEKDYMQSEITSIKALSILRDLEETNDVKKLKSFIYNNLGIVHNELGLYEEAIKYFNQSLKLKRKLKGNFQYNINMSLNNLGNPYKSLGLYDLAFECYNEILKNKNLINESSQIYVMALDNYAHTLYLSNQHKQLPELYLKALKICDRENITYESIIIHQHLAEYYNVYNKKDSALHHGYKAKDISKHFYKDDLLKSLLVISRIEEAGIAVKHYEAYINLNDSIQHQERLVRNKYARIQFETGQYIKETKRLNTQNVLIIVTASALVLVLGLLYFIKLQQSKNKRLQYITDKEKANQEIYKLMLQQQAKLEEGRLQERYRISEDLHDGVLSRLFGARMGMGFLDVKGDVETLKHYKMFMDEMQKIEKEVRDVSHELKSDVVALKANFESIIEAYINTQSVIGNFKYKIINADKIKFESFNEAIRVEIYRIIQEAIQNTVKHAKAEVVLVSFVLKESTLKINIVDDGIGFNTEKNYKGIGLKNITSRVLKLEGEVIITSPLDNNKGTGLDINVPITKRF